MFPVPISVIIVSEKGVIAMNQQTSDQGWQQLQDHIENFFGQALRNDVQRIEYKPLFIVPLLGMPSDCNQKKLLEK
jgi:hypothetical protein